VVEYVINKDHLTFEGLHKILGIKASINLGLPNSLKESFSEVVPVPRPLIPALDIKNINSNWLAGFTSGDGSFQIVIQNSAAYKEGCQVSLRFTVSQNVKDLILIESLISYLGCGRRLTQSKGDMVHFIVSKFSDISEKIIPFFNQYPVIGIKGEDFADFCKAAEIIKAKGHLREEGLKEIIILRDRMNKGRS
jgi:hypothetical protein